MAPSNRPCFILPLVLLAGCATQDGPHVVEMEVQPYLVPCRLLDDMACLRAVEDGKDTVGLHGIEGFAFEWDIRQTLRVEKRRYPDGIMDVPEFHYHALGPATRVADTAWSFAAYLFDTTQFSFSGDTLSIMGYPKPILMADSADRSRLAGVRRGIPVRFTVRYGGSGHGVGSGAGPVPPVPVD